MHGQELHAHRQSTRLMVIYLPFYLEQAASTEVTLTVQNRRLATKFHTIFFPKVNASAIYAHLELPNIEQP